MVDQGIAIVAGVRDRHDGRKRNPWNEFECGNHYARALSSWSLLLALSGYQYSAPEGRLGFAPRINAEDFQCFFSTGAAWGSYQQVRAAGSQESRITVRHGRLAIRQIELAVPPDAGSATVIARGLERPIAADARIRAGQAMVTLGAGWTISAGQSLMIRAEW